MLSGTLPAGPAERRAAGGRGEHGRGRMLGKMAFCRLRSFDTFVFWFLRRRLVLRAAPCHQAAILRP